MTVESTNSQEPTPRERLLWMRRALGKRRGLAIGVTCLVLGAIVFSTLLVTPRYKAESSLYIRLEERTADVMGPADAGQTSRVGAVSPLAVLNSYVEALLSRTTAEQIVREFGLDQLPPPTALRERIKDRAVGLVVGALSAVTRRMAGGVKDTGEDTFRKAVDDVRSSVAAEIDQDTELVLITVLYPDRALAQKINQRMIDILAERSLNMSRADAVAAYKAVMAALPDVSERVAEADRALSEFKRENGIVALSEEQRIRIERLDSLDTLHNDAKRSLEESRARLAVVQKELAERSQPITLTTVVNENPTVRQIQVDLYAEEGKLAGLRQTYTEDHPEVVRLKAQIDATHERLRQEVARIATAETKGLGPEYATLVQGLVTLESDMVGLAARERAVAALLSEFRSRLSSLPAKERKLESLAREQQVAAGIYMNLSQKAQQLQNSSLSTTPPVSMAVVDPPRLPKGISDIGSPPYLVILIVGPIISLLIGLTSAFVAEYFDDSLGTEAEVTDRIMLPVLASIPRTRGSGRPAPWQPNSAVRDEDA